MYAMPEGGNLEISTRISGDKLYIVIRDTGTGIKPEHMKKIFDSFFTTKTESVQGVGLGLSVCYGFIKDHDGDITVESEEGRWTKFTIMLPLSGGRLACPLSSPICLNIENRQKILLKK